MVWRGLRLANGSWKIIWIDLRIERSWRWSSWVMSRPWNSMRPPVASISRSSVLPSVDLPQPDSPTSATVSPASTVSDTSSTARSVPVDDL